MSFTVYVHGTCASDDMETVCTYVHGPHTDTAIKGTCRKVVRFNSSPFHLHCYSVYENLMCEVTLTTHFGSNATCHTGQPSYKPYTLVLIIIIGS